MLLGANGQVGQALRAEPLPADWELRPYARQELDITDHMAVQAAMHDYRPDVIINPAAVTNVDAAQHDPQLALAVNFDAIANFAAQCSAMDIPFIHLSTDYVFDGRDGEVPYKPDDKVNPINIYGDSKFMGEEALRHELAWHVILRVSSVFSVFSKNLLTGILGSIDTQDEIRAAEDQICAPTYAPDIAKGILAIVSAILKGQHNIYGTYHLCGTPAVTRLEFVQTIMDAYAPYTQKRPRITPVSVHDTQGKAPRPAYSVMDCAKTQAVFGVVQRDWRIGLGEALEALMQKRRNTA